MVADIVEFTLQFEKIKSKIRDTIFNDKVKKQIRKKFYLFFAGFD